MLSEFGVSSSVELLVREKESFPASSLCVPRNRGPKIGWAWGTLEGGDDQEAEAGSAGHESERTLRPSGIIRCCKRLLGKAQENWSLKRQNEGEEPWRGVC